VIIKDIFIECITHSTLEALQNANVLLTYLHPGKLSLAIPLWVGAMSTGQREMMLCDWGVKADMVLFAGNTV